MNLSDIRDGLQQRLREAIPGLRCYDIAPDRPELPAAVVVPGDPYVEYNSAFSAGLTDVHLEVRLLVSTTTERWQNQLDDFCSAGTGADRSILDAIAEDRTLRGTVNDAFVVLSRGYGTLPASDDSPIRYGTVTLEVLAHVPRT